jgi:uncharacterized membrane protein
MKLLLQFLIILIAFVATYGTYGLVVNEWRIGDICPKIVGFPACYIVLLCFTSALISSVIPNARAKWIYFGFVGIVTIIAITGSIGELAGVTKCPRTDSGIPMCYISMGICLSLLILKMTKIKLDSAE